MSEKVAELLKAALLLSPDERQELVECLEDSLDSPDLHDGMTEEEFVAELNRRAAELKADPSLGIPWEEVKKMRVSDF
ncbi:MAG TPA: addiction module protein [Gemmataceae bacterium]|jgi:putative addiction module component (TIGR02574 family)|nr:addiction module protein [Gemmataceae bacterium]